MNEFVIRFDAEVVSFNFKPIRKNKSEGRLTLVTESYAPGKDFAELMDMNGRMVTVTVELSPDADAVNAEPRSR